VESRREHPGFAAGDLAEPRVAGHDVYQPQTSVHFPARARTEMIQETYRLLAVAVFFAMASCWFASRTLPLIQFLVSTPGLILSLFAINAVPQIARRMLGSDSRTGTIVLALDGLLSGIALAPLVFLALLVSGVGEDAPNLVQSALVITAFAFLGITAYVHKSGARFNWGGGLFSGLFFTAMGLLAVNLFFPGMSFLSMVLLGVVGIMGVVQILYGTSAVLNDPDFNDPISGALILFAGIFNLFQVVLNLLLSFGRRD
jgi:FtsH-binding integral membrane protein